MNDKPPCMICRGAYDEHFNDKGEAVTQHAYTNTGGDLKTHAQVAEQKKQSVAPQMGPMLQYMGNAGLSVARLAEVLLEKGVISTSEALYIAGFASKPAPSSGFLDPMLPAMKPEDGE